MAIHKRRRNVNPVFYGEQPISLQLYNKFRQGSIKRRRFSAAGSRRMAAGGYYAGGFQG
jgi:hypothetical protein